MSSRPELIEDREIARLEDDRLGHSDIASQLETLVRSVPTPSNIALYGAWGSGKSGIGNMLAEHLSASKRSVKFARFDAFKYAENPLRRNFISVVADALGNSRPKYHADLYSGRTQTSFHVPAKKLAQLLGIFAIVVFVCAVAVSCAVGFVALLQGKNPFVELGTVTVAALPASLVPASLLTAVIALVGRTFVVDRRIEKAESDEEFETLLREIVDESGADRVVIFIDELDRCAPSDVVETLNAVRTFFGVPKCVFVVAADQQVIEEALSSALQQATPADALNPYYSAGSAYLDKVFQYQLTVPPLMTQSVTSFAVELVDGRGGVWQHIDTNVIASILVPTHVRSPRRVKNLLNAFVLEYRIAIARQRTGRLDVNVLDHVDELARLVCLRIEFPLFARDLVLDPDLAMYVQELSADPQTAWDNHPYVSENTREIAEGYAQSRRAVDRVIFDSDEVDGTPSAVQATQGRQLLEYLSRTRLVAGPTKALLHLQNTGPLHGLPSTTAEKLERDAQNRSLLSLQDTFESLNLDRRPGAFDLLISQTRSAVGVEVNNVATGILALVSADPATAKAKADAVSVVVVEAISRSSGLITEDNALGAWKLAQLSSRPEAVTLGQLVLTSNIAGSSETLLAEFINNARKAVSLHAQQLTTLVIDSLFFDQPSVVLDALRRATPEDRIALLDCVGADLGSRLKTASAEWQEAKEAVDAAADAAASAAVATTGAVAVADDDELDRLDPAELIGALAQFITTADLDRPSIERVITILLAGDHLVTRNAVEAAVLKLDAQAVSGQDSTRAILRAVRLRQVGKWAGWLHVLTSSTVAAIPGGDEAVFLLVDALRRNAISAKPASRDHLRSAAEAIALLLEDTGEDFTDSIAHRVTSLGDPLSSDDTDVDAAQTRLQFAQMLVETGVSIGLILHERLAESLTETISDEDIPEEDPESPLAEFVLSAVSMVLTFRSPEDVSISTDAQIALGTAISNATWPAPADLLRARAIVAAHATAGPPRGSVVSAPFAAIAAVKTVLSTDAFLELVGNSLRGTPEAVEQVIPVLKPLLNAKASAAFCADVTVWQDSIDASSQYTLANRMVGAPGASVPPAAVLNAIGWTRIADEDVASILIDRYLHETNNQGRTRVLDLWAAADLTQESARKRLIADVLVPTCGLNSQATSIALARMPALAAPVPKNVKRRLGDAVLSATKGHDTLEAKGRKILLSLGYSETGKGLFGLRKEIDTSR